MLLERFLPETRRLQRPRERSQVAVQVMRMLGFTARRGFILGAGLFIPSVLLADELNIVLLAPYGLRVSPLLVYIMACVCVQTLFGIALRRSVMQHVRKQLNELGLPVCMLCGYDLTGNVSGTCPECGQPSTGPRCRSEWRWNMPSAPDSS